MPNPPYVETHLHLWNFDDERLFYGWLEPGAPHPVLSQDELAQLNGSSYLIEDFVDDAAGSGCLAAVHVQAAVGIPDPVDETAWLQATADRTGWPQAIIAHADLADSGLPAVLDRHGEFPLFRGIRDFGRPGYLEDPAWRAGFAELGRRGLIASVDCTPTTMPQVESVLREVPGTRAVIDHMGFPQSFGDEEFERWQRGMRTIARHEQVVLKVSEMGMVEHGWTLAGIERWIHASIEIFGPERIVFGTNWPVDRLYGGFGELVDAYRALTASHSPSERLAMLAGNAVALYSIDVDLGQGGEGAGA